MVAGFISVVLLFYIQSSSSADSKRAFCQLVGKECALSICNKPSGGLSRNSVARIANYPLLTLAVHCGSKALNQPIMEDRFFLGTNLFCFNKALYQ